MCVHRGAGPPGTTTVIVPCHPGVVDTLVSGWRDFSRFDPRPKRLHFSNFGPPASRGKGLFSRFDPKVYLTLVASSPGWIVQGASGPSTVDRNGDANQNQVIHAFIDNISPYPTVPIQVFALVGEAACGVWDDCRFEPQPCLRLYPRRPRPPFSESLEDPEQHSSQCSLAASGSPARAIASGGEGRGARPRATDDQLVGVGQRVCALPRVKGGHTMRDGTGGGRGVGHRWRN
eukprot:scaffold70189_cov57-Phaeocystis_antarctica.AAC.4